jgi:putative FmdB family regulatory protein
MPLYEYLCTECKNEFEKIVLHHDTNKEEECPKCGKISKFIIKNRRGVKFFFNYMEP